MGRKYDMLLAFYGDDFTGSTDALEFLTRAGIRTVLFLETPSPDRIARFSHLDAIGVAGMTRAMSPAEMTPVLKTAFDAMKALHPRHVHYKVCSTFDSSPDMGNIGTAIEVGQHVFENSFTPILVAAPHLGRYSAFANLYARMGIGSEGTIHRLDRHPSMSRHPITPADESDLRLHLSRQLDCQMGLIDLIDLNDTSEQLENKLNELIARGDRVIFLDALYDHHMRTIGELLDLKAQDNTLFTVGSSGIEKALGDYWLESGAVTATPQWEAPTEEAAILVLSGSCSPVTAGQIAWATAHGFEDIPVEVTALQDPAAFISAYSTRITEHLKSGRSVILHTCMGPDDPRMGQTREYLNGLGFGETEARSETALRFGAILGQTARQVLTDHSLKRLVIAGGDTSGHVARALGIEAVEMIAPVYTGAPLCRAFSSNPPVDGMEVNLKGGQVGDETYFEVMRTGKTGK